MEKEVKVEPYGVIKMCDECAVGEMVKNGKNSYTHEIKIGHKCNRCGNIDYYDKAYPVVNFRIIRD